MNSLDLTQLNDFVNTNIVDFHAKRIATLEKLTLDKLLKSKNPYLFRAKNFEVASDLMTELLSAFLSSSEEKIFGDFLEDLAVYISQQTIGGWKSASPGIDLEFIRDGVHYVVAIKSGPNWGNSSQHKEQARNFQDALIRMRQSQHGQSVEAILGICYGRTRTNSYRRVGFKVTGQNFWYLISGIKSLYTEIIEPIGYQAKQHNDEFSKEQSRVINRFTEEFLKRFTDAGSIEWEHLVQFNSGNYDLKWFD